MMDFLYEARDLALDFATHCWVTVSTMDPLFLGGSAAVAFLLAIGFVVAIGPASASARFLTFIVVGALCFAAAVTLVELGPVLFNPADLARSQVTPEIN